MSLARDTYEDTCSSCNKIVVVWTPKPTTSNQESEQEKWVRCSDRNQVTRCQRITE